MSPQRKTIPTALQNEVLLKSRRRCALCFVAGDTAPKLGDIAKLTPPDIQPTLDNLVYLCADHHAEVDRGRFPLDIAASARDQLYHVITSETELARDDPQRTVLVIHGRDMALAHRVLRFLEMAGLKAIRVSEHPSLGRTVLEKLEQVSDVGCALVLLTPDDIGGPPGAELRPRARQNVVFELGYLLGRLGRNRVIVIAMPSIEVPSDFHGLEYIPVGEEEGWKGRLSSELSAAGLNLSNAGLA